MPKQSLITKAVKRQCRYKFNDEELLDLGKLLAEVNTRLTALEEDKKRVTSDFKARIDGATADVTITVNKIQTGYEWREMPCTVHFDKPKNGRKQFVRDDNGEIVGEENMNEEDKQTVLDLQEPEKE